MKLNRQKNDKFRSGLYWVITMLLQTNNTWLAYKVNVAWVVVTRVLLSQGSCCHRGPKVWWSLPVTSQQTLHSTHVTVVTSCPCIVPVTPFLTLNSEPKQCYVYNVAVTLVTTMNCEPKQCHDYNVTVTLVITINCERKQCHVCSVTTSISHSPFMTVLFCQRN